MQMICALLVFRSSELSRPLPELSPWLDWLVLPKDLPKIDSWLRSWVESDVQARDDLDSFNGVFHHLTDAWARRHEKNVILVHYQDLLDDLGGEMQRIADRIRIDIDAEQVRQLAPAASFTSMRVRSAELAPDPAGMLKDKSVFFRSGRSGVGRSAISASDLDSYHSRSAESAPEDLLDWLHRDGEATT